MLPSPADHNASIEVQALPGTKVDLEGRGIHQIMFNHDSSLLLVVSQDKGQIWAVEEAKLLTSVSLEKGATRKWLKHPFKKDTFIRFWIQGCHRVYLGWPQTSPFSISGKPP